ncbi:hypothetical protein JW859_11220 [bacterium]|nr:hypothetical protein [bacterium]
MQKRSVPWQRLLLVVVIILAGGCSFSGAPDLDPLAEPADLSQALAEVERCPLPDGVDADTFALLKAELARVLSAQPATRQPAASADDIRPVLTWDATTRTLSWYYTNAGDYDQNGQVNVSDLTPLGVNFGLTASASGCALFNAVTAGLGSPFGSQTALGTVDGDRNGEINAADITPIGRNFGQLLSSYRLYASSDPADYPDSPFEPAKLAPLAEIGLADAAGDRLTDRLSFSYSATGTGTGNSYWVRPVLGASEGPASNVAGAALAGDGALALLSVSPSVAEPGQMIVLEFSDDVIGRAEDLVLQIGDQVEVPVGSMLLDGARAVSVAPLVPAGPVTLTALDGAASIGSVTLTIRASQAAINAEQAETAIETSIDGLLYLLDEGFQIRQYYNHDLDLAAAQADLAELDGILQDLADLVIETLNELSPEDQALVLSYFENAGYFASLGLIDEVAKEAASHAASRCWQANWENLHLDCISANLTNIESITDGLGLAAILTGFCVAGPAGAFTAGEAVAFIKVFKSIIDGIIDTFYATDLYDIRMTSYVRDLVPGEYRFIEFEGRFCAECLVANGTVSTIIEAAINAIPLVGTVDKTLLRKQFSLLLKDSVLSSILSKLGERASKELLGSLEPIADPDDPCAGRIGGEWIPLDLMLYTSTSREVIYQKALNYDDWYRSYPQEASPGRVLTASCGAANWEVVMDDSGSDRVLFRTEGKHTLTCTAFSFNARQEVWLGFYNESIIQEISRDFPVYVGRYGDWRNAPVSEQYGSIGLSGLLRQPCLLDGHPTVLFRPGDGSGNLLGWYICQCNAALDECSDWQLTPELLNIMDFTPVFGLPTLLHRDTRLRLLHANDSLGRTWDDDDVIIPRNFVYSGTHTGDSSAYCLVDENADFYNLDSSTYTCILLVDSEVYASVEDVWEAHKLYAHLPDGETYDPGEEYRLYFNPNPSSARMGSIGGKPAITYLRLSSLYFSLAQDTEGLEWEVPVRIGNLYQYYTGPLEIGGRPGLVAWDPDIGIYYFSSDDEKGEYWHAEQGICGPGALLRDFANVFDAPAVCIQYETKLWYVRADDATGFYWNPPVELFDSSEVTGCLGYVDLAIIDGKPGVCFTCGGLKYRQAADETGSAWDPVEMVDSESQDACLIQTAHGPGIFYVADDRIMLATREL